MIDHGLSKASSRVTAEREATSDGAGPTGRQAGLAFGLATTSVALLGLAYLLAPPMGTDLSAQVARADFFRWFDLRPIDFRWYGGINQLGYSLSAPAAMSMVGARLLGVLSALAATIALTHILLRTGARRPVLGAVFVAAVTIANIVSGRITFAAGLALAAGSLALAVESRAARPRPRVLLSLSGAVVLAVLATMTSPIAGLFLGLAATAWLLADLTWDRSVAGWARPGPCFTQSALVAAGAALGLIPMLVFSLLGNQPFSSTSMKANVALTLAVVLLLPASLRVLRVGAVLTIGLLFFSFYVPTAIGSNSLRLPMLFALPVVVAYSRWRSWALAMALLGMFWWQSPVMLGDVTQAGAPETKASFYRPLLAELDTLGPLGRIEVVPLRDHWESSYVADAVPLARGWLRQVDVERNPIFYASSPPTRSAYGDWLRANAVTYVAFAPSQPLDVFGRTEAAVVSSRPGYLREIWRNKDWRLYRVVGAEPFVDGGTLVSSAPGAVQFDTSGPGLVILKVRWSRWLTVSGGACLAPSGGGWTTVRAPSAGRYTISSGLRGSACG